MENNNPDVKDVKQVKAETLDDYPWLIQLINNLGISKMIMRLIAGLCRSPKLLNTHIHLFPARVKYANIIFSSIPTNIILANENIKHYIEVCDEIMVANNKKFEICKHSMITYDEYKWVETLKSINVIDGNDAAKK